MGFEQVDAPEAANHALAMLGTAVGLAMGFLQSEILAGGAVGGVDSDLAEVHGLDLRCVITIVIQRELLQSFPKVFALKTPDLGRF